jgi:transcription initiation factor TFIID subunit 2
MTKTYLSAPDVDYEVRWYLLKLADMVVRGAEEQPPKVTIHLPPTPVTEVPPPLPVVKLNVKASRPSVKTDLGTPARSPLTPFAQTPKVRLVPSGSVTPGPVSATTPVPKRTGSILVMPKGPKGVATGSGSRKETKPISKAPQPKKALSSGMEQADLSACRNMLRKLQSNKHATLFLQPVDPVRDKAPNYFDIIKNPMDLTTIGAKLQAGQYPNRAAFEGDFRLMINNCKQYNLDGTYPWNEAAALEAFFDKRMYIENQTFSVELIESQNGSESRRLWRMWLSDSRRVLSLPFQSRHHRKPCLHLQPRLRLLLLGLL